jgi:hypothetical protein
MTAGALMTPDREIATTLGVFPGFGLGHVVARSSYWSTWLAVDLALAAVWLGGVPLDAGYRFNAALGLTTVVERLFEGIHAYHASSGRFGLSAPPGGAALAAAIPVHDPATGPYALARP